MEKVRFGVIGIGNMGSSHCSDLYTGRVTGGCLTAFCDIDPVRLAWAEENFPEAQGFSNADDMFKSGLIDAVVIAVPHYDHPCLAMKAFQRGLHVMIEKPAGVYTKHVREMNEAAEKSGLVFGIMYQTRTSGLYKKMKQMVDNGEVGEIKRTNMIVTTWYRPQAYYDSGGWRATWAGEGGGVLLNQCPHSLDLWQWIGGMPCKVTAFCHEGKWHDIEVEDDVTAYVEYPNGATGSFVTATADAPGTNRFEVTGDRGKLICEKDKLVFYRLKTAERAFNETNTIPFAMPEYDVEEIDTDPEFLQHVGVLIAFADRIMGRGELIAEGREGLNGLTISNAMHLSSWLGKTVEIPFDEDLFYQELQKRVKMSKVKERVKPVVADLTGTH